MKKYFAQIQRYKKLAKAFFKEYRRSGGETYILYTNKSMKYEMINRQRCHSKNMSTIKNEYKKFSTCIVVLTSTKIMPAWSFTSAQERR